MMTTFSCWLLYIASYNLVYAVIGFCVVYSKYNEFKQLETFQLLSPIDQLVFIFNSEKVILLILLFLTVFSMLWIMYMKTWKNNTRIRFRMYEDSKADETAFIFPYVITIITVNFDIYGWVVCLLIYGVIGSIFVQTRKIQMSPIFILSRYHILTDGINKVITRDTVELFNLTLDDCPEGIQVRELTKNTYIALKR